MSDGQIGAVVIVIGFLIRPGIPASSVLAT
jgi:hypothetical protein